MTQDNPTKVTQNPDDENDLQTDAGEMEETEDLEQSDELEESDEDDTSESEPRRSQGGGRSPFVMLMMIVAAIYLMWSLKDNLLFYFVKEEPVDLGNAIGFEGTDLPNDSMVTIHGVRNPGRGIALSSSFTSNIVFPLMGTTKVLVEIEDDGKKKTLEEALATTSFTGRLVRIKDISYYQTIRDFAAFNFGMEVTDDVLLIQAHKKPSDNWIYLLAYAALVTIILANSALLIWRLSHRDAR